MWFLTRSTGIVAAILAVASLVLGLAFSGRFTRWAKPNWWLAMHNWLGGLTLAFIGGHMLFAFFDSGAALRLVDLFVPGDTAGWSIGWGVVAAWIFVLVSLTSVNRVRRLLPRQVWHLIHLLSIPALGLAAVHTYQSASDLTAATFGYGFAIAAGIAVYPLAVRLAARRRARPIPATAAVARSPR